MSGDGLGAGTVRERPGPLRMARYLAGAQLPERMREWVANDAAGPGHNRRYWIRGALLFLPVLIVFAVLPIAVGLKVGMALVVLVPAVYFLAALRQDYLETLLADNEIDPHLHLGKWAVRDQERLERYAAHYRFP